MRILIVDDEVEMAALISRGLSDDAHETVVAHDGIDGMTALAAGGFELAVVDVMLPGMSGFELCRRIKETSPTTAVILLTARDAVDDRVRGLDAGADDYMTKPFAFAELAARIRAVRRRDALVEVTRITVGDLQLDTARHRAFVGDTEVRLSRTEFDLARLLAVRTAEVVSRAEILDEVWESSQHIDANVVDQYVSYLRRKLTAAGSRVRISTARGVGFRMDPP